jgi:hypothetical protein
MQGGRFGPPADGAIGSGRLFYVLVLQLGHFGNFYHFGGTWAGMMGHPRSGSMLPLNLCMGGKLTPGPGWWPAGGGAVGHRTL